MFAVPAKQSHAILDPSPVLCIVPEAPKRPRNVRESPQWIARGRRRRQRGRRLMMDPLDLSRLGRNCVFAFPPRSGPTNGRAILGCARHKLSQQQPGSVCVVLMSECNLHPAGFLPCCLSILLVQQVKVPGFAGISNVGGARVHCGCVFHTTCIPASDDIDSTGPRLTDAK